MHFFFCTFMWEIWNITCREGSHKHVECFWTGKKRKNILHEKITDHEVVVVVAPIPSRETGLVILRLPPVSLKVPERVRPFRDAHILRVRSTQSWRTEHSGIARLLPPLFSAIYIFTAVQSAGQVPLAASHIRRPGWARRYPDKNHQSAAVTTAGRNLSAEDSVPRQLVVINSYQGIKKTERGRVFERKHILFSFQLL